MNFKSDLLCPMKCSALPPCSTTNTTSPPAPWQEKHGDSPLLAETFTDIESFEGTGDALHCERENMQLVIENDGDFLFQLKGNQPTALKARHANPLSWPAIPYNLVCNNAL